MKGLLLVSDAKRTKLLPHIGCLGKPETQTFRNILNAVLEGRLYVKSGGNLYQVMPSMPVHLIAQYNVWEIQRGVLIYDTDKPKYRQ